MRNIIVTRRIGPGGPPVVVVPDPEPDPEPPPTPDPPPAPDPTPVPTAPLLRWSTALDNRTTAPAKALFWGDSRTEGEGASSIATRWQDVIAASIRAAYPTVTAAGTTTHAPHNYSPITYVSTTLASLGDWSSKTYFSTPNNYGLGTRVSRMTAAGHGATLSFTGTAFKLMDVVTSTGGSFTYAVDGGAAVTVSWPPSTITDGRATTVTGLTAGSHTVVVKWVSGEVYLEGAQIFHGEYSKGIQFYDGGHSGTRAGNTYGAGLQYVTQSVAAVNPHLIVLGLMTNDYGGNIDPVLYKQQMKDLIAALKAGCTAVPSIVLTLDWKRTGSYTYAYTDYITAAKDIAKEDVDAAITLFDLQAAFPVAPDNTLGYFRSDMVHETDAGQARRAELLKAIIAPVAAPVPVTPTHPVVSTPMLPFDQPTTAEWAKGASVIVGVHNMANWRRSVDDKGPTDATEYYERVWRPPGAIEGGTDHRKYGGFVRNRPLRRNTKGGSATVGSATGWNLADKRWEIQQMKAAGFTHTFIDILGTDTFAHVQEWGQAAVAEGGFKCIAMPDCNASIVRNDPTKLGNYLSQLFTGAYAAGWQKHTDGRWLVAPYSPDTAMDRNATATAAAYSATAEEVKTYWINWSANMISRSVPAALWCCFQRAWRATTERTALTFQDSRLSSFVVGYGRWGDRDPIATNGTSAESSGAIDYAKTTFGKPFLYTTGHEDMRPDQSKFFEAGGWEQTMAAWNVIISKKPGMVQIATGNDWREGAAMLPSIYQGWTVLDVMSYYIVRWRLGYYPTIVRDALYIAHRRMQAPLVTPQPSYTSNSLTGSTVYTKFMARTGSTPERNQIDVMIFATASSQVQILIANVAQTLTYGSTTGTTITVPAGVSRVQCPLKEAAASTIVATLKRGGTTVSTVTSPFAVNFTTQVVQDLTYCRTGSLRGPAPSSLTS